MTPSEAIDTLLGRPNMTEATIAKAVGVSQGTINKIKRGDMIPNWETGQKLVALALTPVVAAAGDPPQAEAA